MSLYKYLRRRLVSKQLLMPMSEVSPKLSGSRNQSKKLKTKLLSPVLCNYKGEGGTLRQEAFVKDLILSNNLTHSYSCPYYFHPLQQLLPSSQSTFERIAIG